MGSRSMKILAFIMIWDSIKLAVDAAGACGAKITVSKAADACGATIWDFQAIS